MASKNLTPAFAAGLERSGKPVRQHALVKIHWHALPRLISLRQTHPFQIQRVSYLKQSARRTLWLLHPDCPALVLESLLTHVERWMIDLQMSFLVSLLVEFQFLTSSLQR